MIRTVSRAIAVVVLLSAGLALRPSAVDAHCGSFVGVPPNRRVNPGETRPDSLLPSTTGERSTTEATLDPERGKWWWRLSRATWRDLRPPREAPRCPPDLRTDVVDALREALAKGEPDLAGAAAVALGRIGGEAVILRRTFVGRDLTPSVKEHVLFALAVSGAGDDDAFAVLGRVLEDRGRDDCVRGAVALGLGLSGEARALPALLALVKADETSAELRAVAAFSLGLAGDPIALPELTRLAGGKAGGLPVAAIGRIGSASARATLRRLLTDERANARRQATLSLACAGPPPDETEARDLGTLLGGHPDPVTRLYAAVGLARAGEADPIRRRLARPPPEFEAAALRCTLALAGDDPARAAIRREYARKGDSRLGFGLGVLGDGESTPEIEKRLKAARDWDEVEDLTVALSTLGDGKVVEVLLGKLSAATTEHDRGAAVGALARVRPAAAIPALLDLLGDAKASTALRALAASALGALLDSAPCPLDRRLVSGVVPELVDGCLYEVWGWL